MIIIIIVFLSHKYIITSAELTIIRKIKIIKTMYTSCCDARLLACNHEYAAKQQDSKVTHHMESSIMHFAYIIDHENMVPKTYTDAMRTAERKQ